MYGESPESQNFKVNWRRAASQNYFMRCWLVLLNVWIQQKTGASNQNKLVNLVVAKSIMSSFYFLAIATGSVHPNVSCTKLCKDCKI